MASTMEADEGICTASERSVVIIPPVDGNELSQEEINFLKDITSNKSAKKRKSNKKRKSKRGGGGRKGRIIHETTLDDIIMEERHQPIDIIKSVDTLANDSLDTLDSESVKIVVKDSLDKEVANDSLDKEVVGKLANDSLDTIESLQTVVGGKKKKRRRNRKKGKKRIVARSGNGLDTGSSKEHVLNTMCVSQMKANNAVSFFHFVLLFFSVVFFQIKVPNKQHVLSCRLSKRPKIQNHVVSRMTNLAQSQKRW